MGLSSLAAHRQQYPALANKTYFNFGGQGPLSQAASTAIQQAFELEQTQGPFSTAVYQWLMAKVSGLREALAALLGSDATRIILTESTTAGMNIPVWGINWQPGDQLVLSDAEHPGIWQIAHIIAQRFGVEILTCPLMHSPDPAATLADCLTPRTRMVMISHVLWNTGRVLPLTELVNCCHAQNVLLHIDAAQSAGVLPLDLPATGVDSYAFTGHKWLCGPAGVGAVYLSEVAQQQLQPSFVGWRALYGQGTAGEFEVATSAWALLVGFKAALELHQQAGSAPDRYARQKQLAGYLWEGLGRIPGVERLLEDSPEAGLISFTMAGKDPVAIEATLAEQKILLRSLPDPVCLRASVHYFSTEADIDHLLQTLDSLKS